MKNEQICPKCGNPIAADAISGPCPKCMLQVGVEETMTLDTAVADAHDSIITFSKAIALPVKLQHGDTFGDYCIRGLLGKGGMGQVYDAYKNNLLYMP